MVVSAYRLRNRQACPGTASRGWRGRNSNALSGWYRSQSRQARLRRILGGEIAAGAAEPARLMSERIGPEPALHRQYCRGQLHSAPSIRAGWPCRSRSRVPLANGVGAKPTKALTFLPFWKVRQPKGSKAKVQAPIGPMPTNPWRSWATCWLGVLGFCNCTIRCCSSRKMSRSMASSWRHRMSSS